MAMRRLLPALFCLGLCTLVLLWPASDKTPAREISAYGYSKGSVGDHHLSIEERTTLCMGGSIEPESHDEHKSDHEEDDHDDHEHHHYDIHDYLLGVLLIAAMVVMALLKLLINFPNYHVREVTWMLLSGSISIFLAVFTWNVFQAFVSDKMTDDEQKQVEVWRICAVFFYVAMFVIISCEARLGWGAKRRHDISHDHAKLHEVTNFMHTVTFLAHAAAFSSMTGWSLTLNHDERKENVWSAAYLLFSWFWKVVVYCSVLAFLRLLIIKYCLEAPAQQHDNLVANHHHEHDHLVEHWVELLEEGETDFFSLVMSFLLSAVLVFAILGKQIIETSGHEGLESLCSHTTQDVRYAYSYSFLFLVIAFFYAIIRIKREEDKHAGEHRSHSTQWSSFHQVTYAERFIMASQAVCRSGADFLYMTRARVSASIESTLIMTFAWLFIYASQWLVALSTFFDHPLAGGNKTCLNLMVAMICMSFAGIFVLLVAYTSDQIHKCHKGPAAVIVSKALREMMKGMGFLVGFTWEQAFNHAIGAISWHAEELTAGKVRDANMKLALFFMTVFVIYPTWSWYIVPMFTEKGYLFGFVPRNTAMFARQVLNRRDVDLKPHEKLAYLEKALEQVRKEMILLEEAPSYQAPSHTQLTEASHNQHTQPTEVSREASQQTQVTEASSKAPSQYL